MDLPYRIVNVFSIEGDPFSGNPLCVFESAGSLSDADLQAWARQFNLSETSFVTTSRAGGEAEVRIFTASYEMPFAGHPTLGTAHVVAQLAGGLTEVRLRLPAGTFPVERVEEGWQLRAKPAVTEPLDAPPRVIAEALGIDEQSVVAGGSAFVDTGVEQLLVQLHDVDAVRSCTPDPRGLGEHLSRAGRPAQVYVWAWTGEATIGSRFFGATGSMVEEDPATGSAASNLGGLLVLQGRRGARIRIDQGDQVARPSRIHLTIDEQGCVFVGGRVTEVGAGSVRAR